MGLDIEGWIEVYDAIEDSWIGAVELTSELLYQDRNPVLMNILFGVRSNNTPAIARNRGIPDNASKRVQEAFAMAYENALHSHTWICLDEIRMIEWLEENQLVEGKPVKQKYIMDGNYKVYLTGGFNLIFDMMELLAKYHSDDNVRLVVWFG
ncbi:MAG: hypothetical protein AAFV93_00360 [Chloroflexota bacterium]